MPFPFFGIIGGGNSSFELFKSGDSYLPSVDRLDASLTINDTTVTPTLRYKGGDADGTDWDAWTYGETLGAQGSGGTFNDGSPLLGTNDDSWNAEDTRYFQADNNSFGQIDAEDFVFEFILKASDSVSDQSVTASRGGGYGYLIQVTSGVQPRFYGQANPSGVINSYGTALTAGAWYHLMFFCHRGESSPNGARWYANGKDNAGGVAVTANSLDSGQAIRLGASETFPYDSNIAYIAMWKQSDWLQAGAAGPTEWATIAQERFAKLIGVWPQKALGTSTPNGWSSTSGRNSFASLDKLESGNRKIYLVGTDWLRYVDREDSNSDSIKGYLSETSVQNKCLQSEDLDTTWTKIDAGDTIGGSVSVPDKSTSTTSGIIPDSTDGQHGITQDITLTAATHTFSVFAKVGSSTWLYIIDTTSGDGSYFNLSTGVLGTAQGGATAYIEDWGDGWYRCGFQTAGTAAAHTFEISPAGGDGDNTVVGNGSDVHLYAWGVQCEVNEYMSSYIPTTTSAVTRAADTLQFKGDDGNLGGVGSNQKGTFLCNILFENYDSETVKNIISFSDGGSAADNIVLSVGTDEDSDGITAATGGNAGAVTITNDLFDNIIHTLRLRWEKNNLQLRNDSTDATPDTSCDMPDDLDEIDIGMSYSSGLQLNGVISQLKIWPNVTLKS